jgi:hypothetical protein
MANKDIIDWEDLSPEDQDKAEQLLAELNTMFSRYPTSPVKDETVEEVLPE